MDTNEEPKKGTNRVKKEAVVEELKAKLDGANSIVLTDYQGLTHKQIEEFKRKLKVANASYAITKNTLFKISLSLSKNFADKVSDDALNAPTATIFIAGDVVEPLKILQKLVKETGLPKIKIGVVDGATLTQDEIVKLASLPSRDTLLAQLVGTLNSPIQGLVVVLNGNIQKLVMVLNAVAQNKPAEKVAAPQPTPAAQTEVVTPTEPAQTEPVQTETPPAEPTQTETPVAEPEANPEPVPTETVVEAENVENNSDSTTDQTVDKGGENS